MPHKNVIPMPQMNTSVAASGCATWPLLAVKAVEIW